MLFGVTASDSMTFVGAACGVECRRYGGVLRPHPCERRASNRFGITLAWRANSRQASPCFFQIFVNRLWMVLPATSPAPGASLRGVTVSIPMMKTKSPSAR